MTMRVEYSVGLTTYQNAHAELDLSVVDADGLIL